MADRPRVVVVGGGATGTGTARDLALRGADVTLVERESLTAGTTGRSHGVLHSGARYAESDPAGAEECIRENRVVRGIAGACVADTGGYFVRLDGDDPDYYERKREACWDCAVPVSERDGDGARAAEPGLSTDVERVLSVPDAVVYPSRLVAANAADAVDAGATVRTGAAVTDLRVEGDRVVGVGLADGERLQADHVVNAAGPWAGRIAALADVTVEMRPTAGAMVVADADGLGTVLNRCRSPADGDIVVPHGETVVLGTTSVPVEDPDDVPESDGEVDRVREETAAMFPAAATASVRRVYRGVRPLYAPDEDENEGRAISRGFTVLDHADRDGVGGLTTVVGGKLTTYRLMAEATADAVTDAVGLDADCVTAERALPGHDDPATLDEYVRRFGPAGPADADVVQ